MSAEHEHASRRGVLDHLVGAGEQGRRDGKASAFAVLRLITSSNFVGSSIGRSPAFAPLSILFTYRRSILSTQSRDCQFVLIFPSASVSDPNAAQ